MADTNLNSPLNRTGSAPKPRSDNRRSDADDELDAALDAALARGLEEPDVSFKRQWDAGLQAELDAALSAFDAASLRSWFAPVGTCGRAAES